MMAAASNSARIMEQIEVEPSQSVGQVVGVRTPEPQVQSRKYRVGRSEKWSITLLTFSTRASPRARAGFNST